MSVLSEATALIRFWSHVEFTDTCWLWTAGRWGKDRNYGCFKAADKTVSAHKWIYERFRGPVPEGLVLDHVCEMTLCVNPWHLRPVTNKFNVLRGRRSVAALNARKTHCKRGHEFTPENTHERKTARPARICVTCFPAYLPTNNQQQKEALDGK